MNTRPVLLSSALLIAGAALAGAAGQPELPKGHPQVTQPQQPAGEPTATAARPEDVKTIDGIIAAFYASTSGSRGQPRDWERFKSLFTEQARLLPIHKVPHGETALFFLTVPDYIEANRKYMEKGGFAEREISRRTEEFGSIAHIWSTFESRRDPADPEPYARGLYSIQLAFDGSRWWIANVLWNHEREGEPIPERYLPTPSNAPAPPARNDPHAQDNPPR